MRSSGSGKKQNFFWRHFNGIAMAAIVLIPTIYTTLFLGSMWDPYGNVDQLPVAVVNNDKSVDYEGKELAVGDELVTLSETSFWIFASAVSLILLAM